jgi:hypothetical protein
MQRYQRILRRQLDDEKGEERASGNNAEFHDEG